MKKETKQLDQLYKIDEMGAGLDTTHLNYCPDIEEIVNNFGYIKTKIGSCNDHVISELTRNIGNNRLITEVNFTDLLGKAIQVHLEAIGADWIDILELPASLNWNENFVETLKVLYDSGQIYSISIKNPGTPERVEEIRTLLAKSNLELEYISLDICPIEFNYDLVTWCNENHISIIGYNPFGGNLSSATVINSFTVPYLLGFAATYCFAVILSGRDIYKSVQSAKYLNKLEGEYTSSMYTLKKSVHKLLKPLKKVVFTSANIDLDYTIPYDSPEFIPVNKTDVVLSLGKSIETEGENKETNEVEKLVLDYINTLQIPFDAEKEEKFYIIQSQVIEFLKNHFKEYEFSCLMINNTTIAIKAEKESTVGFFIKETIVDTKEFLISMKSNGTVFFKG